MTSQPNGFSSGTFNETVFNNLDANISFHDYSQYSNSQTDIESNNYFTWLTDVSIHPNGNDKLGNEYFDSSTSIIPSLAPIYGIDEGLFPEYQLEDSQPVYLIEEPVNEVTITTTPTDAENEKNNSNEYKNLSTEEIVNKLKQECDQIGLKHIDDSIQEREMAVVVQPPNVHRNRYESDGKRQISKSRTNPMAVKLPPLKNIEPISDVTFWLRLALITHNPDPSIPDYIHMNKLEYHSDEARQLTDGTVCVPLTPDEIQNEEITLSRSSITKTLLGAYKPQLNLYNQTGTGIDFVDESEDEDNEEHIPVKDAKIIFKEYNLKASRIVCQLIIKQNESIRFTNITCETHVIEEKTPKPVTKKRRSRAVESDGASKSKQKKRSF